MSIDLANLPTAIDDISPMTGTHQVEKGPMIHPVLPEAEQQQYLHIIKHGLPRRMTPQKIIIIGAGMAGLTAAYELLRAGHDPIILEASSRLGGRCYTIREPFADGLYAEAGAMRFQASHKLVFAYLKKFQLQVRKFAGHNPDGFFHLANQKRRVGETMADPQSHPHRVITLWDHAVAPLIEQYRAEKGCGRNIWPQIAQRYREYSLRDFLVEQGWAEADIQMLGTVGVGRGGYGSIMNIAFLELFRLCLHDDDGTEYQIVNGTDQLVQAIVQHPASAETDSLTNRIRYGAKVEAIEQRDDEVIVHFQTCTGSQSVRGHYAITTIPFSLFRFIDVQPALSPGKQKAINELHYINATKIFLQCKSRPWEKSSPTDDSTGLTITDTPARNVYFPAPGAHGSRAVVLASYSLEDDARIWAALPPEERIKKVVQYLDNIYPGFGAEVEVGASCNWSDPQQFAGGAFAMFTPGQMATLHEDIVKPEGLLHFAGEHTSYEHGWVEGAIESGLREALNVHQRIEQPGQQKLWTDIGRLFQENDIIQHTYAQSGETREYYLI